MKPAMLVMMVMGFAPHLLIYMELIKRADSGDLALDETVKRHGILLSDCAGSLFHNT